MINNFRSLSRASITATALLLAGCGLSTDNISDKGYFHDLIYGHPDKPKGQSCK